MTQCFPFPTMGNDDDDVSALKLRAERLQLELTEVAEKLKRSGDSSFEPFDVLPPPGKSGYLFKWQDRTMGWGGTKWALRFARLDRGRISYFYSHLETSARYTLSLRGCAVRDEGWKRNRRYVSKTTPKGEDPPIEEPGAYFFVFSIYYFDSSDKGNTDIVPLLRFSTPSLADKNQWIQLLSEACAYCETHSFLKEEASRNEEEERRRQQQIAMAQAMPQAERGTLPPLYFAHTTEKPKLGRRPSLSKIPNSTLFRTVSRTHDAEKAEKKGYAPSRPMHRKSNPSFLSAEAQTQNYRGFFNLAMIILLFSNFRLILSSARKYGFVLAAIPDLSHYSIATWDKNPFVSGVLILQISIVLAFIIEYLLASRRLPDAFGMALHQLNAHGCFGIITFIVWNYIGTPALGGFLLFNTAILWLKLLSYAHANQDYRLSKFKHTKENQHSSLAAIVENLDRFDTEIDYPTNVTLGNIYYFWLAPTLTYQIAFPKTPRVRMFRVLGILLRMVVTFLLMTFIVAQTVAPNLDNLLKELEASNGRYTFSMITEYWLKLSIPNTYIWLMMFYLYFHLYLNLFAELTRFGDRVFYRDWWNSGEVSAYWRLWNLPVHYWLVRHMYFPCLRIGIPKGGATFIVFLFSAVMHELLVSIPFHMIRPWAFLGMMGQIPLVVVTKYLYRKYPDSSVGNILFWVSFCLVGQPMAILLYSIDYTYGAYRDTPGVCESATDMNGVCIPNAIQ
eukprot:Nitzschia sp. Nitz4//scaffold3_size479765//359709//362095//NITZ4_000149-RA/size479765-augustus-gene-1.619-mRNA-1//-1//CDS//3329550905//5217//frame0